jgi:hypothetical protein
MLLAKLSNVVEESTKKMPKFDGRGGRADGADGADGA